MKIKFVLAFILQLLLIISTEANAKTITNIVIFGDSLSDRGSTQYGGFNRYSNGPIWVEYLAKPICSSCLQDYAWSGAKSDYSNYNGSNWSGLLWQIDQYKPNSDPKKTLYIIWIGANDIINGDKDDAGAAIANNINLAINKLVLKGAKDIVVFTLPDLTLAPAFNDKHLPEYNKYFPVILKVRKQISACNSALRKLIPEKNKDFAKIPHMHLYFVDIADLFDSIIEDKAFLNIMNPWVGPNQKYSSDNYMWWDAWHPMTSVHASIADHIARVLKDLDYTFSAA